MQTFEQIGLVEAEQADKKRGKGEKWRRGLTRQGVEGGGEEVEARNPSSCRVQGEVNEKEVHVYIHTYHTYTHINITQVVAAWRCGRGGAVALVGLGMSHWRPG